ncbi:MAG: hypothetical protein HQ573_01325 [Desulfobacteraceae bacterium]|nr:hypothetical protein [Desulfobacteraceae bacterium]
MNFVADESVDRQIVERLRDDGYFVRKRQHSIKIISLRVKHRPLIDLMC